ncbi:hypothetical protein BROUX41_000032 [Berkeleyomyces rouxiae]|uniref:uncharacterized protein n=1 Tax=Berkeleyomyces rouxiae TaxID=2035830 RepID=UPI003B8056B0
MAHHAAVLQLPQPTNAEEDNKTSKRHGHGRFPAPHVLKSPAQSQAYQESELRDNIPSRTHHNEREDQPQRRPPSNGPRTQKPLTHRPAADGRSSKRNHTADSKEYKRHPKPHPQRHSAPAADRGSQHRHSTPPEDHSRARAPPTHADDDEEPRAMRIVRHLFAGRSSLSASPPTRRASLAHGSTPAAPASTPAASPLAPKPSPAKSDARRLGISELGLFAYEKRMPSWLQSLLERRGTVALPGMIPALSWHLNHSKNTGFAYLAHAGVQQVFKLRREGHFCGYRNIQTMTSFIIATECLGNETLKGRFPTIFEIQELVERAWDAGINSHGRAETGGIRGTRKYIGTSEAEALFSLIGTPCSVRGFRDPSRTKASQSLLDWFLAYFSQDTTDTTSKVRLTEMPPVYLQNPRHSMVVVGIEREASGDLNLLVFDPKYHDHKDFSSLVDRRSERATVGVLNLYRRGMRYLGRHNQFEVLYFQATALGIGASPGEKR